LPKKHPALVVHCAVTARKALAAAERNGQRLAARLTLPKRTRKKKRKKASPKRETAQVQHAKARDSPVLAKAELLVR
jgi:hypothetical protein